MPKHWYVYHLIDPRDHKVFYVGKGTRLRISAHETEARRGVTSKKCNKIREIWAEDLPVERKVLEIFTAQRAALVAEAAEIARIGLGNLTNLVGGEPIKDHVLTDKLVHWLAWVAEWSGGFQHEIAFQIPENAHPIWARIWEMCNRMGPCKIARAAVVQAIEEFGLEYVNEKFKRHAVTFS